MPSEEEAGRSCPEAQTPQQLALISMNLVVADPLVTDTLESARHYCRPPLDSRLTDTLPALDPS